MPTTPTAPSPAQPLAGIRILDLSRVLAGPFCTQQLADLGAEVIKVERPHGGDDARRFGPPWVPGKDGQDTHESSYFVAVNRNKRSITVDMRTPEGQALIRRLAADSDVLVENFKVGSLKRLHLSYEHLKADCPRLVYCSITGFGQTGPYAHRAGYDFLAQGMGGMMSITGEPEGTPMRVGTANADELTGMYAALAILAALRRRDASGEGCHIDVNLLDSQVAWLTYQAQNYLLTGNAPERLGNKHPAIMPYDVFEAADGYIILAIANDAQFQRFCDFAGCPELPEDPRFHTNPQRVRHRHELAGKLAEIIRAHPKSWWLDGLEHRHVPCGPVNTVPEVFADPHVQARSLRVEVEHPLSDGTLPLVGSPLRFDGEQPPVRRAPPLHGQHTEEVLREVGLSEVEIAALTAAKVV